MRITSLDVNGEGLGTLDGRPVAVPLTIPGEDVEARAASRRGGGADLVRVLSPSPHRVAPACRHFGSCGGCSWQHIAYAEQLRLKRRILQELIEAATGPGAPEVLPTLPTPAHDPLTAKLDAPPSDPPAPWHFRNKAAFVFGPGSQGRPLVMGHFRRRSRSVVPIDECPVHREEGNQAAFLMRDALGRARIPGASSDGTEGVARHAVVRVAEDTGDWLTTLVVTENVKPLRRASDHFVRAAIRGATPSGALPQARGLCLNTNDRPGPLMFGRDTRHVAGARAIWERVAGVSFLLSPTSFFQTNVRAARALAAEVLSALSGDEYEQDPRPLLRCRPVCAAAGARRALGDRGRGEQGGSRGGLRGRAGEPDHGPLVPRAGGPGGAGHVPARPSRSRRWVGCRRSRPATRGMRTGRSRLAAQDASAEADRLRVLQPRGARP